MKKSTRENILTAIFTIIMIVAVTLAVIVMIQTADEANTTPQPKPRTQIK